MCPHKPTFASRRLACVVLSNRLPTGANNAENVNAGSDRKVSENTMHYSLLCNVCDALFCWECLGPAIQVEVTLSCIPYLSIVTDQPHPFVEMVLLDGCGLFRQDNLLCQEKMVQEKFERLTSPPNSHLWKPQLATYRI